MLTVEQVIQSNKAAFESAFGTAYSLFGHAQTIAELNLATAKKAFEASGAHTNEVLSVKDAQSLFALQAGVTQPLAEGVQSYGREIAAIMQAASADLSKSFEAQTAKLQAQTEQAFDTASKSAPAGFEGVFGTAKSMMEAQQRLAGYTQDAVSKATGMFESAVKQASDAATDAASSVTSIGTKTAVKRR